MSTSARYVRREGTEIRTPPGSPPFRRGMGLGGWLLPEGYMWGIHHRATSPHRIEQVVRSLVGPEAADEFWRRYRAAFVTADDIRAIAEAGFDHVRLPINARLVFDADHGGRLLPDGIAHVDDTIAWCTQSGISCVLDLHGAPGGQTGTNIDDSPHAMPEMFTDDAYFAQAVRLWELLAERYRDEPTVACFDLLNEPLPDEHAHLVPRLVAFYREVTAAIRRIDPHHLLSYEGNHWATRFELFDEVWDDNSCLHFHKYWSEPTRDSITPYLDARERLGLPLWMGESGENTDDWYRRAFSLLESEQIPWTFWTWKKIAGPTSPVIIDEPEGWAEFVAHAEGRGPAPKGPHRLLDHLLENLDLARCTVRAEALEALTGTPGASGAPTGAPTTERHAEGHAS